MMKTIFMFHCVVVLGAATCYAQQACWPCPEFIRGDCDEDGDVDWDDLDCVGACWYYFGTPQEDCPVKLDRVDVDDSGTITVNDWNHLNQFLNTGSPSIPEPNPAPGLDPTADPLDYDCDIKFLTDTSNNGVGIDENCQQTGCWPKDWASSGSPGDRSFTVGVDSPELEGGHDCNPGSLNSTGSGSLGIRYGFGPANPENYTLRFLNSGVVKLTGSVTFKAQYDARGEPCITCGSSDYNDLEVKCNDTDSKLIFAFTPFNENEVQIAVSLNGPHERMYETAQSCPAFGVDRIEITDWSDPKTISYEIDSDTIGNAICTEYPTMDPDLEVDFQRIDIKGIHFILTQPFAETASERQGLQMKVTASANWAWVEK